MTRKRDPAEGPETEPSSPEGRATDRMTEQSASKEEPAPKRARVVIQIAIISLIAAGVSALLLAGRDPGRSSAREPSSPAARRCDVAGVISEGERIPADCLIEPMDGGPFVSLKEAQAGKPFVINFWASWCVYCIREMPDFQRVYERAAGRVSFLGLDLLNIQGETRSAAAKLAGETGVRYPLGYDEGAELYARMTPRLLMPTTILVRADGRVAFRQFGPLTARQLQDLIRKHFGIELEGE